MKLPHSKQNVQPGFYFYPIKEGGYNLLRVENAELVLVRQRRTWVIYQEIADFWDNPPDNSIAQTFVEKAIQLIDNHQEQRKEISSTEIENFNLLY